MASDTKASAASGKTRAVVEAKQRLDTPELPDKKRRQEEEDEGGENQTESVSNKRRRRSSAESAAAAGTGTAAASVFAVPPAAAAAAAARKAQRELETAKGQAWAKENLTPRSTSKKMRNR